MTTWTSSSLVSAKSRRKWVAVEVTVAASASPRVPLFVVSHEGDGAVIFRWGVCMGPYHGLIWSAVAVSGWAAPCRNHASMGRCTSGSLCVCVCVCACVCVCVCGERERKREREERERERERERARERERERERAPVVDSIASRIAYHSDAGPLSTRCRS